MLPPNSEVLIHCWETFITKSAIRLNQAHWRMTERWENFNIFQNRFLLAKI